MSAQFVTNMKEFFKTDTDEELLSELKTNLKRQSQIDYYDYIYNHFVDNNDVINKTISQNTVIPGLNRVLKLAIYAIYNREKLYPKVENMHITKKLKRYLINMINDDEISIIYFKTSIAKLLKVISSDEFSDELDENDLVSINYPDMESRNVMYNNMYEAEKLYKPDYSLSIEDQLSNTYKRRKEFILNHELCNVSINKSKCFCEYIIIGNSAAITSLDGLIDGFFIHPKIFKLFITANLYETNYSPHADSYTKPVDFYIHDVLHYQEEVRPHLSCDDLQSYEDAYLKCKINNRSFLHRYISFVYWMKFFEGRTKEIYNTFDLFFDNLKNTLVFKSIDHVDLIYCVKWITKATDFTESDYVNVTQFSSFDYLPNIEDYLGRDYESGKEDILDPCYIGMHSIFDFMTDKFLVDIAK